MNRLQSEKAPASRPETTTAAYGCEHFGRLGKVLLRRPGEELRIINEGNRQRWLFDQVPDVQAFIDEHDRYRQLLSSHGVEVLELADHVRHNRELMRRMPNLTYMHDIAVITSHGAILSYMAMDGRRDEHVVVREALGNLGIPILAEFEDPADAFEGCLLLSPQTVLVAETERHSEASIRKFIPKALKAFDEVIYVRIPKARRYMHPDTIYNRVDVGLALAYLPAFGATSLHTRSGVQEIDFAAHMGSKGVEIVSVSDDEQRRLACSFVPLEPGVMFHYDTALSPNTQRKLARKGVEIIFFHPKAMVAGGGSLRCLTLRIHRVARA